MKRLFLRRKKIRADAKKQMRHTHATAAAFEDAIAIMNDIIFNLGDALKFASRRAEDTLEVLKMARRGPHSYDADRPSGRRLKIRRR